MKTIFKTVLTKHFTTLPNAMLRDKSLSFRARGLLAMVLSNKDDWEVFASWLKDQATEGVDAVRASLRELEASGYAVYTLQERAEHQRFTGAVWTFYDAPVAVGFRSDSARRKGGRKATEKPSNGKPCSGFPLHGNPLTKKDSLKEELSKEELSKRKEGGATATAAFKSREQGHPGAPTATATSTPPKPTPYRKPSTTAALPSIPAVLDTAEFRAAWSDRLKERLEAGRRLTPTGVAEQFRQMSEWGPQKASAALRRSIGGGYAAVYEPKDEYGTETTCRRRAVYDPNPHNISGCVL